jgi:hypothetical protein
MTTDTLFTHAMLVLCEYCGLEGPCARLGEHYHHDHPELFWPEPTRDYRYAHHKMHHPDLPVMVPGRFRYRLERIQAQSEQMARRGLIARARTLSDIVAGALDAQGLGRRVRPRIRQ